MGEEDGWLGDFNLRYSWNSSLEILGSETINIEILHEENHVKGNNFFGYDQLFYIDCIEDVLLNCNNLPFYK